MKRVSAEEIGKLKEGDEGRYWEIKLSKYEFLTSGDHWFLRLFWYVSTALMLVPLILAAEFYRRKYRQTEPVQGHTETSYRLFTDIYPGCVYSPLVKGYELELFKNSTMPEPILEIGIGDGYFSHLLFESKKTRVLYGADLIYGVLKSARQYQHFDHHVIMDALETPFPDNFFGTVMMNNLIHHLPNRAATLREAFRILRKGGRLIFTDNTIGWGTFTWEQRALRAMKMDGSADRVLKFKLHLFAQNLLADEHFYDRQAEEMGFRVIRKVNFISKRAMYLSSLFEFLQLKQGQPTRPEMRKWLSWSGCRREIERCMAKIIESCHQDDRRLSESEGFSFQFLELEKASGLPPSTAQGLPPVHFVCPKCKGALSEGKEMYSCKPCDRDYPVFDGIPIFLSYYRNLKGLEAYLEKKEKEQAKPYMT
jgi:SAM-dependent methyltransferase